MGEKEISIENILGAMEKHRKKMNPWYTDNTFSVAAEKEDDGRIEVFVRTKTMRSPKRGEIEKLRKAFGADKMSYVGNDVKKPKCGEDFPFFYFTYIGRKW